MNRIGKVKRNFSTIYSLKCSGKVFMQKWQQRLFHWFSPLLGGPDITETTFSALPPDFEVNSKWKLKTFTCGWRSERTERAASDWMHLQQPNMDNKPSKNFFPSHIRDILSFSFEKRKNTFHHMLAHWQAARNAISRWWSWLSHYVIKIYRNARVFFFGKWESETQERRQRENVENSGMNENECVE